eukprot:m.133144 g.133144  ORF g.133144 m.133144 type:complete len:182 (-) comp16874_c0_seq4:1248-1793(-)
MAVCCTVAVAGLLALVAVQSGHAASVSVPQVLTPPMGWMSWEVFRCEVDCLTHNETCINEYLYKSQTDRLVADGYLDAGYDGIHLDDCWMRKVPSRDIEGRLVPDKRRFPSGFKALGDYMHSKNVRFAIYTAESPHTCAKYPASAGHEEIDADTFASWGQQWNWDPLCFPKQLAWVQLLWW